ncbi:NAD(P)H-dependent oxidoreductase [Rickettsiales bacterium LUAb2]
MKKLLLVTHPNLTNGSTVNKKVTEAIRESKSVDTIKDLYQEYPDFKINVQKEQEILDSHDLIIVQAPFYWYTLPPLFHHWVNEVLAFGYAYGGASKLEGKKWLTAITTGSPITTYRSGAKNNFSISEMLKPLQQSVNYCYMEWLPVFSINGTINNGNGKPLSEQELNAKIEEYINLIRSY